MRLAASIIALSFTMSGMAAYAQQPAQRQSAAASTQKPGVVEGIVVNQITGEPVRRAEVRLMRSVRPGASGQFGIAPGAGGGTPMVAGALITGGSGFSGRSAATDQNGVFRITNVDPGDYRVVTSRQGFIPSLRSSATRQGDDIVSVGEGETVSGVRLALMPQAVFAGRVIDEDGEPMQGVMVGAAPRSPSSGAVGRRGFRNVRGVATNDLGEFRLTGIAPGKVLLTVQPPMLMGGPTPVEQAGTNQAMGYVAMYYPGVTDPAQAQVLDPKPGAEIANLDVKLRRVPVFKVTGRAFDADGAPMQRFMVTADAAGRAQWLPAGLSSGAREDGTFEISNLPAGDYNIIVRPMGRGPGRPGGPGGPGAGGNPSLGITRISVSNQNIEGLVVQAQPGFEIKGVAKVEATGDKPSLAGTRVSLLSDEDVFVIAPRPAAVQDDNSFMLSGLMSGKYRLYTSSPAAGLYLASVKIGGQEMFGRELDLSNGPPAGVQLVFRMDGGKVSGTIDPSEFKDLASPPTAVLVAADESLRESLPARSVQVSQTGSFEWTDIRPGEYLIWVYDNYDSGEIADPDFVKSVEHRAIKVRVGAAQSTNVSTRLTIWPSQY